MPRKKSGPGRQEEPDEYTADAGSTDSEEGKSFSPAELTDENDEPKGRAIHAPRTPVDDDEYRRMKQAAAEGRPVDKEDTQQDSDD